MQASPAPCKGAWARLWSSSEGRAASEAASERRPHDVGERRLRLEPGEHWAGDDKSTDHRQAGGHEHGAQLERGADTENVV